MLNNIRPRVIPVLTFANRRMVKTTRFRNPVYLGDPLNIVRIFNDKQADELILLDISKSRHRYGPDFKFLSALADECLMPLAYGGGIRNLSDAQKIFSLGFEKVIVQTSALHDINLISQISDIYGSQSVVFSLDLRRGLSGRLKPHTFCYRYKSSCLKILSDAVSHGCGEIFINFVHVEGTMQGTDIPAISLLSNQFQVPIIYCGGIRSFQDIMNALVSGADGICASSYFVFAPSSKSVLISYLSNSDFTRLAS